MNLLILAGFIAFGLVLTLFVINRENQKEFRELTAREQEQYEQVNITLKKWKNGNYSTLNTSNNG